MGGKKIVATSDVHLGQSGADNMGQYSLLSSRAEGNLVRELATAVAAYAAGDPVTLVVVGDLLDLSLSYLEDALVDLEHLLAPLAPHVERFVYVIGNHDHHIWSMHCEEKRITRLVAGEVPHGDPTDPTGKATYHTTSAAGEPSNLLDRFVKRCLPNAHAVTLAYPTYAEEWGPDREALLYFTHGHLTGGIYSLLSDFLDDRLPPASPHERSASTVNHPIIESVYWLLGETGEGIGADGLFEHVYTDLQRGDRSQVRSLVERAVHMLVPEAGVIHGIERRAVTALIMHILTKHLPPPGKNGRSEARHDDVEQTRAHLQRWIDRVPQLALRPQRLKHIFYGHTHVRDEHAHDGTFTKSWNLGTWLVEPNHPAPRTGFLAITEDANGFPIPAWHEVK